MTKEELGWEEDPTEEEQKWMNENPNIIVSRPREEIKELATKLIENQIFTSYQVRKDDAQLLSTIFMPLALMSAPTERVWEWYTKNWAILYGDMGNASPTAVNGYPCFFQVGILNKKDSEELLLIVQKIKTAMESA